MIFRVTQSDNDTVGEAFDTMLRSAVSVDRPLRSEDTLVIMLGTLMRALTKAEDQIAALEQQLSAHTALKKH